jgi:hypothetical protein
LHVLTLRVPEELLYRLDAYTAELQAAQLAFSELVHSVWTRAAAYPLDAEILGSGALAAVFR